MNQAELYQIETVETIAMLCLRWGKREQNAAADRLGRLLMILRQHHMGRRLCKNCLELLSCAITKVKDDLDMDNISLEQLKTLAGEKVR